MEHLVIQGGNKLYGEIDISGMKNSALPIIFSCILIEEDCILDNIPRVSDVENALEILRLMGAKAHFIEKNKVLINTKNISENICGYDLISKMRASSYLMGVMLSRFKKAFLPAPGGCNFGHRPIDLHLKGFQSLGASIVCDDGFVSISVPNELVSRKIVLDKISVGATINMILASIFINGTTIIKNVAQEPHVDDLICFLNRCGAKISREKNMIVCDGVNKLHGTSYKIFPDMIEALTYTTYLGITKGEILLKNIDFSHLKFSICIFEGMGYTIKHSNEELKIKINKIPFGTSVITKPYPGFPTDLHPQLASLLCFTKDGGIIKDEIFPTRFRYVNELQKMNAKISNIDNSVLIKPSKMRGATTDATDLRAGAALVGAALGCREESRINNVNYIVRGYENIVSKLTSIGGKIKIIKGDTNYGSN